MPDFAPVTQPRAIGPAALRVSPVETRTTSKPTLDTFSPVTQNGSFEFDRIIKAGEVLKRTRRTKSWKPTFIVLRPNLLSIYRDKRESQLRHQIALADLTAVARQQHHKRKDKYIFGLFTPSRNYHLEASSEREAQDWVELIRREARIDKDEEELVLASPGGAQSAYHGFGRSIDAHLSSPLQDDRPGYSSSDAEVVSGTHPTFPQQRPRGNTNYSQVDYSGADYGSYSDFSESAGPAARLSALSLAYTDGRPSTSSTQQQQQQSTQQLHSIYGPMPTRPLAKGAPNASQASGFALAQDSPVTSPQDDERVVYHGWTYLLKSKSGVRQWKKVWMVLRAKALAIYKNEEEYTALLIMPLHAIIDVVEIDQISRSKTSCMQVISEERNYRFCALDEEALVRWLGAFKSLLSRRKAKLAAKEANANVQAAAAVGAVQPPALMS